MHVSNVDNLLWLASDSSQLLLLVILLVRRMHRVFPVFSAYISWQLISDLLLFLTLSLGRSHIGRHYAPIYFSLNVVTYLFELGVLLEIGTQVLRPARRALSPVIVSSLLGVILAAGTGYFFFVEWLKPNQFSSLRVFLVMDTTAAILCLAAFLLVAGFSQILGLTWKNHVLQLATGLAFYSLVDLVVELMHSHLRAGPSYAEWYQFWGRFQVISYVGTVSFWCYAFLKQEAPRKEFSPQMQKILVQLSGSAKRHTAVLARSREP